MTIICYSVTNNPKLSVADNDPFEMCRLKGEGMPMNKNRTK